MTPERILITGAAGFVGRHVLAECGAHFPAAECIAGTADVTDATAVDAMVAAARPDAVIHLAGIASVPAARAAPDHAFAVNLGGTLALARAMLDHAPDAVLIHAGSAECYGASFRGGLALDETAPLAPLNTYAASKAAADLALGALVAEAGLRAIRFRPFNHAGPGQSDAFVLAAFASQIARIRRRSQPPVIKVGNLDASRDFLDVRDVVRAYVLAIERAEILSHGAVFNLASGTPRRIGDILARMIGLSGIPITVEIDPERLRPVDIPIAGGNAGAARANLGWTPEIPFEATLLSVLESAGAHTNDHSL